MSDKQNLYLSKPQLKAELDRCLSCKNQPCMKACPISCNPQEFIQLAKQGMLNDAAESIRSHNPFGQSCGLVCPDKFCMKACTRSKIDFSVNIPKIQATILEQAENSQKQVSAHFTGFKIAVVGAGPAGVSAANVLASQGHQVVLFDASDKIGGALNLIPNFRLPKEVIEKDWQNLPAKNLITLKLKTKINNLSDLLNDGFDGVIAATGEQNCRALNIAGEELCIAYNDYLATPEMYKTSERVAVIGGGNVAVDCALTAAANGAEHVEMFVRRKTSDMRISKQEYLELLDNGININSLTSPVEIKNENNALSLVVRRNRFVEEKLCALPNSENTLPDFTLIIKAVGSFADEKVDNELIVYAGDSLTGGSTLVEAAASGKNAATLLCDILANKKRQTA